MPTDYQFKTTPYAHQEKAFLEYRDREYHAHLWEMRVGKTKISIDTCAWLYSQGRIDAVFIIAPNGVHLEWADQIPEHCPDHICPQVGIWVSSPNAAQKKALKGFSDNTSFGLKFLCMNIDAVNTEKGRAFATSYLQTFRCMFILDEGSIIKNCDAQRTKAIIGDRGRKGLAALAPYRRLLNGTPITQSPLDLFPQFLMLDEYILGTSHVAFRNRYAIIELQGRMQSEIKKRLEKISATFGTYPWGELVTSHEEKAITAGSQPLESGEQLGFTVHMAGRMAYDMRWRCGTKSGSERLIFQPGQVYPVITGYRHLDELQKRIAPFSDRVLRKDCYDLPEKTYQKRYVELSTKQEQMYKDLKKKCITECHGKRMSAALAITKMLRLQQIVGGFYVPDQTYHRPNADTYELDLFIDESEQRLTVGAQPIDKVNPRIEALVEDIRERLQGKVIVWARFVAEIQAIQKRLSEELSPRAVRVAYGQMKAEERQQQIKDFQDDPLVAVLIANPACKGVSRGQNLSATSWEVYYSNSFSLEDREQSEARPFSMGVGEVGIIDMIAPGTLDEHVISALRDKKEIASLVLGDALEVWI